MLTIYKVPVPNKAHPLIRPGAPVQKIIDDFKIIWHAVIALVIANHVPACPAPPTFALDRISDRWKLFAKTAIINHRYRSSLYIS